MATLIVSGQTTTYNIRGTIIGPEGDPVQDAFVMMKEDPILCALTAKDGTFVISAIRNIGASTLLASWSACETTILEEVDPQDSGLIVTLSYQNPQFTKIETGAAFDGAIKYCNWTGPVNEVASPEMQDCYAAYQQFMLNGGDTIRQRILDGITLTEEESPYRYIALAAIAIYKESAIPAEYKTYRNNLIQQRLDVLDAANNREIITEEQLNILRDYCAAVGFSSNSHGAVLFPGGRQGYWSPTMDPPNDFYLTRIEQIFDSENFSPYSSLSLTEYIRFEGLAEVLHHTGYRNIVDKKIYNAGIETADSVRSWFPYERTRFYELLGDKPLFMKNLPLEDRAIPDFVLIYQHLEHAYGDHIRFVDVNARSNTWGDMYLYDYSYHGRHPDEDPYKGKYCHIGERDFSPERTARSTRLGYMERPYLPQVETFIEYWGNLCHSMELHVDAPAYNPKLVLLDKDGIRSGSAYLAGRISQSNYWLQFQRYDHGTIPSLIIVEKDIQALLDNNGYKAPSKNMKWQNIDYPKRTLPMKVNWEFVLFEITSINKITGVIVASSDGVDYQFSTVPNTRFSIENGGNYSMGSIDNLNVGDEIRADIWVSKHKPDIQSVDEGGSHTYFEYFDMTDIQGKVNQAAAIYNYAPFPYKDFNVYDRLMVFSGTIDTINGRMVTVKREKPTFDDYPGLRYWNEDEDKLAADFNSTLKDGFGSIGPEIRDVMMRWMASAELYINYTFMVDDATRITRHGDADQDPSELQIGDKVTLCYQMWWEDQHQGQAIIHPELILASEPINNPPTINLINDVFVNSDAGLQEIDITGVSDGNDGYQTLSIEALYNNDTLVENIQVNYTSGSATGKLLFDPVPGKIGTLEIILKLKDSGGTDFGGIDSTEISFNINVLPVGGGNLPTLNDISDLEILEDASLQTVSLSGISDGDGGKLKSITATSSDVDLIPNPSVIHTLGTDHGELTLEPQSNKIGTAQITVVALDSTNLYISKSFNVQVLPVNDPPTIDSIPNVAVPKNNNGYLIDLTGISDGDQGTQILSITATSSNETLISNYPITYQQGNNSGTFVFSPNPDQWGESTITLTIQDNGGTANGGINKTERTFTITVDKNTGSEAYKNNMADIIIYPNPATKTIIIESLSGFSGLTITDISGRVVLKRSFSTDQFQKAVDISMLKQGTYFISILTNDKLMSRSIVIKN